MTDKFLSFRDEEKKVTCALKLDQLPEWGNVGALANMQIDAVRFQYTSDLDVNQAVSFSYQVIAFSESSFLMAQDPRNVGALFELAPSVPFVVGSRDYRDYIREEGINFIVYDRNQLDTKIVRCKLLELVYSNDRYVLFKIKSLV